MKFETVVYEKLIEIVRTNTSIYDLSTNEHKEFVLQNNIWRRIGCEMGIDALALANLVESDIILTLSKVAPVITVSMYSLWRHFLHGNAIRRRHYGLYNVNNQCVFSHASWKWNTHVLWNLFHFMYVQKQRSKKTRTMESTLYMWDTRILLSHRKVD